MSTPSKMLSVPIRKLLVLNLNRTLSLPHRCTYRGRYKHLPGAAITRVSIGIVVWRLSKPCGVEDMILHVVAI